jgi:hypothetical protein
LNRTNSTEIHIGIFYLEPTVDAYAVAARPISEILVLDIDIDRLTRCLERHPDDQYLGKAVYSCEKTRQRMIKEYGA